jgi:hypothetical protein
MNVKMQSLCLGLALVIPQNCFIHIYVLQNEFPSKYFASVYMLCTLFSHLIIIIIIIIIIILSITDFLNKPTLFSYKM